MANTTPKTFSTVRKDTTKNSLPSNASANSPKPNFLNTTTAAGVGVKGPTKRPESYRQQAIRTAQSTRVGPTMEARNSEFSANRQLATTTKNVKPKPAKDYFTHIEKTTSKTKKVYAENVAMSVGSGAAVPSITDPTTNYALQKKKKFTDIRKRKPPKVM
jgi:hypothetical protein